MSYVYLTFGYKVQIWVNVPAITIAVTSMSDIFQSCYKLEEKIFSP